MNEQLKKDKSPLSPAIVTAAVVFIALFIGVTAWGLPKIMLLTQPHHRAAFVEWVDSLRRGGWVVVLLIQILQVILAFIPGEPLEVIAGGLYGTVGGFLLCEAGILIGTACIYMLVKKIGLPIVRFFISAERLESYGFLRNTRKLNTVVFFMFLIPGTPKDALTYLVPLTRMGARTFFTIAILARIPSVLTSTFAGAHLLEGNWELSLAAFALTGVMGLAGLYVNSRYVASIKKSEPVPDMPGDAPLNGPGETPTEPQEPGE